MSGNKDSRSERPSDSTALRDDEIQAVTGGTPAATQTAPKRRTLRIGDPNDPTQVAEGLKRLF